MIWRPPRSTLDRSSAASDVYKRQGKYLSGELSIPLPEKRNEKKNKLIKIVGARENNLKNLTVEIPLNKFVVITGVSGSGKSTLIHDVFYAGLAKYLGNAPSFIGKYDDIKGGEYLDDVVIVDQSPIGKSPRSNPISYIQAVSYTHLRAHETVLDLVCRLLLEKKNISKCDIKEQSM